MSGWNRPPVTTALPQGAFDSLIATEGVRMSWAKSHICPCNGQGMNIDSYELPGGAATDCKTCFGLGVYWDDFVDPFVGLVTYGSFLSPIEPGMRANEKWGMIQNATPYITFAQSQNDTVWRTASTYDQICEVDTATRYSTILYSGVQEVLPYLNGLTVSPAGAVTTYDPVNMVVVPAGYVVNGNRVTLTDPNAIVNQPYTVEFYADLTYVLERRSGGVPHRRPFGSVMNQYLPVRFTGELLDLWMRQRRAVARPPGWNSRASGAAFPNGAATSTA